MQTVFLPAVRWRFRAFVARQQRWTVVHEAVLLRLIREPSSMHELTSQLSVNEQILTATMSRLMRAGLVELVIEQGVGRFRATGLGADIIASGTEPRVEEEIRPRPINAVFLPLIDCIVRSSDVRFVPLKDSRLDGGLLVHLTKRMEGREHYDTIYDRLTETVRLRPNEAVRSVDPNSLDVREGFVEVRHETLPNLPENDAKAVAKIVNARRAGNAKKASASTQPNRLDLPELTVPWNEDDLVIGGRIQRSLFEDVVDAAVERIVILSTFIDIGNVDQLWPALERAAERGVNVDLLYGAAGEDATKHGERAQELSKRAALSRFSNRISVHEYSVASHSKFLIADDGAGSYVAIIGSCNWLSTPFNAVEISYVIRHPAFVAQVAGVFRETSKGAKLSNDLVSFFGSLSRWGDSTVSTSLSAENVGVKLRLILANEHIATIRRAATEAKDRLIIGSHRFGSTAEQAMLVAAANAAKNVEDMRVIYCMIRKPQFRSDVTALRKQYEPQGVKFVHLDTQKKRTPIHGKYLIWDKDNAVVTSLNWASATVSDDDQTSELGVHFKGPEVGEAILRKLQKEVPQIDGDFRTKARKL